MTRGTLASCLILILLSWTTPAGSRNAFAHETASGSLTLSMVVPPTISLTEETLQSGDLARVRISANDAYELRLDSRALGGRTLRIDGRRVPRREAGPLVVLPGGAGERLVTLSGSGSGARIVTLTVAYP